MAEQKQRKCVPEKTQVMFENRETWCAVTKMKEEDWCRKRRKHYKHSLESHLFEDVGHVYQPRCTFEVDEPCHLQRRHFPAKHLNSQWRTL